MTIVTVACIVEDLTLRESLNMHTDVSCIVGVRACSTQEVSIRTTRISSGHH